jgi:hypothetical protein
MMGPSKDWVFEIAKHIQIWGFGGQRHGGRCQRSRAIESGPCHTGAGQKVSDGFQGIFLTHALVGVRDVRSAVD